jgi:PAS domain S-box-containing protein
MMEERQARGDLLHELDYLRSHIALFERAEQEIIDGELEKSRQWFRRNFDNIAEGVLLTDVENKRLITSNKAICRMLGYSTEEITNLEITRICPPEDAYSLVRQFEIQADGDLVFRKDVPFKRKDGNLLRADIISIASTFSGKRCLISFLRETLARKIKLIPQQYASLDSKEGRLLTDTELKVLRLIVKGMSNKEIAKSLHRSIRTIENHRAHLMKKLRVDNSIELVKLAIRTGLVDLAAEQRRSNDI